MVVCHPGISPDGKVETDDAVDREHEGRGEAGQQERRHFVALPVNGRAAPAEREHAVNDLGDAIFGAVTQAR